MICGAAVTVVMSKVEAIKESKCIIRDSCWFSSKPVGFSLD